MARPVRVAMLRAMADTKSTYVFQFEPSLNVCAPLRTRASIIVRAGDSNYINSIVYGSGNH